MIQGEKPHVYAWFAPSVDGLGQREAGREIIWRVKDFWLSSLLGDTGQVLSEGSGGETRWLVHCFHCPLEARSLVLQLICGAAKLQEASG